MTTLLAHVIIVALAITAYVVLSVTGHDGTPVFVFIAGQGVGAAAQALTGSNNEPPKLNLAPDRSTLP